MTNGKKWLAILMAMVMTLGAASALAEGGMAEDKTMCGEDCMCMDGKGCMQDGMTAEGCMCKKQCACGEECACAEKKLEMLNDELNAVFEMHMEAWEKFFAMLDKEPDLSIPYADYLTGQLDMMREKLTAEEYSLLQADIEEIRRIHGQITMLTEALMAEAGMADEKDMSGK